VTAGDPWAIGFAAALAGLLTVGMTGSLLDAAPTAMLFYLGAFAAAMLMESAGPRKTGYGHRPGSARPRRDTGRGRNAGMPVIASPAPSPTQEPPS